MFKENSQIGSYTLIRKLGRGGFGEVWLAERKSKFVTTKVAVKLPLDEQIDPEAIKHEATLWEQASGHPNVLPIIDADEYDGQVVIVSEYAPDGSLEEWLKTYGVMPVEKAVEITIKILDGLEFLHSRNIIHRDLKPANILLQGETPRLVDFGISRALRTTASSQSSNVSGTFAYMPPEGFDGKRSVQTDVWSVGVNFYQFLTGSLPFPQKEPSALISAIMMREYEPLPDNIPNNLKKVIAKSLAKDPQNRYASAAAMRDDLRRVLRGEIVSDFVRSDSPKSEAPNPYFGIPPTQKSLPFSADNFQDENETVVHSAPNSGQNDEPENFKVLVFAGLGILLIGVIGLGIYLLSNLSERVAKNEVANTVSSLTNSNQNKEQDLLSQQKANLQDEQAALEIEKQRLADERKKLEAQKNKSDEQLTFNQTSSQNYPTTRIKFGRGSVEETISGNIGSARSFVLYTLSGQYLSASVNSGGGCVVFADGSTSTSYTTSKGDSYLRLKNICGDQTSFSLTVYVR